MQFRETIRDTSLTFVVAMVLFGLAGVAWGWFYPTVTVNITAQGKLETAVGSEQAGFIGFAVFVVATTILGAIVAAWTFLTRRRGIMMLLWQGLVVFAGTWWFFVVGTKVVFATQGDIPAHPQPGDQFAIVDLAFPGIGLFAATTVAVVVYWFASVFSDQTSFD